jgi:hypothetical protein
MTSTTDDDRKAADKLMEKISTGLPPDYDEEANKTKSSEEIITMFSDYIYSLVLEALTEAREFGYRQGYADGSNAAITKM